MRKKSIHHLSLDLFDRMRKEYGYHLPLEHVVYTDFPGIAYMRVVIPLFSSGKNQTVQKTTSTLYRNVEEKKHYVALLCGILPYNTECSLHLYEHVAERPEGPRRRIASVISGRCTDERMLLPHVVHKEYCVLKEHKEVTAFFYHHYRDLVFSGRYFDEIVDLKSENDLLTPLIRIIENDEEYLKHFTTLKKPSL